MFGYYVRLALKSFQRTPGLTALMICSVALGISVCIVTLTVYHATSSNPISWKGDRLYTVTMDSWDPNAPANPKRPNLPPDQMTYRDAKYLLDSPIPRRKVVMFQTQDVISSGGAGAKPMPLATRGTTSDFFAMFEVPFLYGGGWKAGDDADSAPVIVLSKELNEKLFGGANSVGRTLRWNDREFRVLGVLDAWFPMPKFYDVTRGAFNVPEDAFVPFGWSETMSRFPNGGRVTCWQNEAINSFEEFLRSDCVWLQMWVELPDADSRARLQGVIDAYWAEQHRTGRFQRPRNNRLTNVSQWLIDQQVVQNDNRMLVGLAFAFLAVCLLNTVGMTLAKFLKGAPSAGVRRALGATRGEIFAQHLVEAGLLCVCGAAAGLALGAVGLWEVHALYVGGEFGRGGYQELTHFDTVSVVWALVLAVVAGLGSGLYPAWRVGRLPPAVYLKSQ
jgi:putative ABC transport system permease protein